MVETRDLGHGRRERDVRHRPDIGSAEDHQQVDRRGPWPDPRQGLEFAGHGNVIERGQSIEVEAAVVDGRWPARDRSAPSAG